MEDAATFRRVTELGLAWVNSRLPAGTEAALLALGATPGTAGVGLAPWRFDTPQRSRGAAPGQVALSATARLAVWAWAADPREACDALDAIFFDALDDSRWRLSQTEPPAAAWGGAPVLSLTLAATVSRRAAATDGGRVAHPAVLRIAPRVERT